jgi:predicted nucleic acid-binding protein
MTVLTIRNVTEDVNEKAHRHRSPVSRSFRQSMTAGASVTSRSSGRSGAASEAGSRRRVHRRGSANEARGGSSLGSDYGSLHAPAHLDIECLGALRGNYLGRRLDLAEATTIATLVSDMPIVRRDIGALVTRIMALAPSATAYATAYDAAYLALAEAVDADLLTRDARLAKVPGITCHVRVR